MVLGTSCSLSLSLSLSLFLPHNPIKYRAELVLPALMFRSGGCFIDGVFAVARSVRIALSFFLLHNPIKYRAELVLPALMFRSGGCFIDEVARSLRIAVANSYAILAF